MPAIARSGQSRRRVPTPQQVDQPPTAHAIRALCARNGPPSDGSCPATARSPKSSLLPRSRAASSRSARRTESVRNLLRARFRPVGTVANTTSPSVSPSGAGWQPSRIHETRVPETLGLPRLTASQRSAGHPFEPVLAFCQSVSSAGADSADARVRMQSRARWRPNGARIGRTRTNGSCASEHWTSGCAPIVRS